MTSALHTHHLRHKAHWVGPDPSTYQQMIDTHVGSIADIYAHMIIHEIHCAWIYLFSTKIKGKKILHQGYPVKTFQNHTLGPICVPNSPWHQPRVMHIHIVHLCHIGNSFRCMLGHWYSLCVGHCGNRTVNNLMREGVRDVGERKQGQGRGLAVSSVISYF